MSNIISISLMLVSVWLTIGVVSGRTTSEPSYHSGPDDFQIRRILEPVNGACRKDDFPFLKNLECSSLDQDSTQK